MRRVQLLLDEDLDLLLERVARDEGVSKSALVRRLVRAALGSAELAGDHPLQALVGAWDDPADDGAPAEVDAVVYGQ